MDQFASTLARKEANENNLKAAYRHEDFLLEILRQDEVTPDEHNFSPEDITTINESLDLTYNTLDS